jgi:hypothetical protein
MRARDWRISVLAASASVTSASSTGSLYIRHQLSGSVLGVTAALSSDTKGPAAVVERRFGVT